MSQLGLSVTLEQGETEMGLVWRRGFIFHNFEGVVSATSAIDQLEFVPMRREIDLLNLSVKDLSNDNNNDNQRIIIIKIISIISTISTISVHRHHFDQGCICGAGAADSDKSPRICTEDFASSLSCYM